MTSFPDPDRDGGYKYRAVNELGQEVTFGIPPTFAAAQIKAADGLQVMDAGGNLLFAASPAGIYPPPATQKITSGTNISTTPSPSPNVFTFTHHPPFGPNYDSPIMVVGCQMDLNDLELYLPPWVNLMPFYFYLQFITTGPTNNELRIFPPVGGYTLNEGPGPSIVQGNGGETVLCVGNLYSGFNWQAFNLTTLKF